MKRIILFLFLSVAVLQAMAQRNITGKVIESDSQEPVAQTTVRLMKPDSTLVTGSLTNLDGIFKVKAPALVFAFALKVVLYHKVAQRHIVPLIYGRTAESLQHDLFGFGYLLFFKQLSYLFKVLPR
jgi:hypothetical protein